MNAHDDVELVARFGSLERPPPAVDRRRDVDDAGHARAASSFEDLGSVVAEMRMGVDHAASAAGSSRGKSGGAASIPSTGARRPYSTCSQRRSSAWPSAERIFGAVSGR